VLPVGCVINGYVWRNEDSVLVEVKAGSIVFFDGYLLHRSLPNRAAGGFRRALVNHYMSASSLLPWSLPKDFRGSVGMADYRDIVMVAGTDPYAWKGTIEIAKAGVGPSGEGVCEAWGGKPAKKKPYDQPGDPGVLDWAGGDWKGASASQS
jgi:hypothetical protein